MKLHKYADHIDVIEDKTGTKAFMLWKQPGRWSDTSDIVNTLNVT